MEENVITQSILHSHLNLTLRKAWITIKKKRFFLNMNEIFYKSILTTKILKIKLVIKFIFYYLYLPTLQTNSKNLKKKMIALNVTNDS